MKRLLPLALLLAMLPLSTADAASRAAKPPALGGVCSKVNAVSKSGAVSLVCHKVGKKLIWQKVGVSAPKTTPSSSPSSTQSPSQTPAPSPKPGATVTISAISPASSYEINVNAKQFSWSFSYAVAGEKSPRLGTEPTLYLPVGKPVQLNISSTDTSHGFWIPAFSLDKEAAAGTIAHLNITADKVGKFPGACNIQCGRGHPGMTFTAEVVSETDYLKIIGGLKAN
ncbi:MAG: hypothetical protein NTX12_00060 [Actinobacteria bacterium]|nr:hypothetical protein [Actinomycetota bacterium]